MVTARCRLSSARPRESPTMVSAIPVTPESLVAGLGGDLVCPGTYVLMGRVELT